MALTSFLKNLFGGDDNSNATATEDVATDNRRRNETLSGKAFKKQLEESENGVLLDVRTLGEFGQGTIPGALLADYLSPNFAKTIAKLDKNATYFVFCRSGNRSAQACSTMYKQGFDVRNLSGGIGAFPG